MPYSVVSLSSVASLLQEGIFMAAFDTFVATSGR